MAIQFMDLTQTRINQRADQRHVAWAQGNGVCAVFGCPVEEGNCLLLNTGQIISIAAAMLCGQPEIARIWRRAPRAGERVPGSWVSGYAIGGIHRPYDRARRAKPICPPEAFYGPAMESAIALRALAIWSLWHITQASNLEEAKACHDGVPWAVAERVLSPDPVSPRWWNPSKGALPIDTRGIYPMPPESDLAEWLSDAGTSNIGAGFWIPSIMDPSGRKLCFDQPKELLFPMEPRFNSGPWQAMHGMTPVIEETIQQALEWFSSRDWSEFALLGGETRWALPSPSEEGHPRCGTTASAARSEPFAHPA